jgi:hypothetical protein
MIHQPNPNGFSWSRIANNGKTRGFFRLSYLRQNSSEREQALSTAAQAGKRD